MKYSNNYKLRNNKVIELFEKNISIVKTIKNLNGGLSNDLFLINDIYVWRVFKNSLIDHKYETIIMEKLDYFFIFYKDQMNICYKFIDGHQKEIDSYNRSLETVIKEIKNIHKIELKTPHIWHILIPKWIEMIADKPLKKLLTSKYNIINKKLNTLNVLGDNVFCHNDIIAGNVLFNENKCFIIDWEFSGINYYFFELGNIVCEYYINYETEEYNFDAISTDLIKKVVKYYNNNDDELSTEKVKVGIDMSHFTWALYSFLMLEQPIDYEFNYSEFAQSRMNQLE